MRDHLEADHPASEGVDVVQVIQREKLRDVRSLQGATKIVSLREEEEHIQWVVEVGARPCQNQKNQAQYALDTDRLARADADGQMLKATRVAVGAICAGVYPKGRRQ